MICPHCGKAMADDKRVCPGCLNTVGGAAPPTPVIISDWTRVAPEDDEAEQIRAWLAEPDTVASPAVVSLRTWIALLMVLMPGVVMLMKRDDGTLLFGTLYAFLCAPFLLWFVLTDVAQLRIRHCRTPAAAAAFYLVGVLGGRWERVSAVLMTHPASLRRRVGLWLGWKRGIVISTYVSGARVESCRMMGNAAATVTLTVTLRTFGSGGLVWAYLFARVERRKIERLLLRRGARWYVINGLPGDAIDRAMDMRLPPWA